MAKTRRDTVRRQFTRSSLLEARDSPREQLFLLSPSRLTTGAVSMTLECTAHPFLVSIVPRHDGEPQLHPYSFFFAGVCRSSSINR